MIMAEWEGVKGDELAEMTSITPSNFIEKWWEAITIVWDFFKYIILKILNKKND
jgi:hypothetical protein